ncbi:CehA/McbA family metallohydrolase [Polyangium aurulentum]|uniref:CehA/McbA family metallohydrolase n=1 Tax=Polyangium aurulentum TaxID=2567896 RepID=UPI00146D0EF9|nr:CehA/McbA family metallohydrolase [Polyangium aurulentum]UQA59044.1 CehA/McbA family metallohydrolase [Polyangium aurulentum]
MRALSALPLALAVLVASSCAGNPEPATAPPRRAAPPPPPPSFIPVEIQIPPPRGEGTLEVVPAREAVPLAGLRVTAKPGDFMLRNEGHVAVVSVRGYLVDFGPENARDGLDLIQPVLELGLYAAGDDVVRFDFVGERGNVLRAARRIRGQPLWLVNFYSFEGKTLWIESAAVGARDIEPVDPGPVGAARRLPALAAVLGERVHWGNIPTWVEGLGHVLYASQTFTDFLARESTGVSYAVCSAEGPMLARFSSQESYGYYEAATTGERVIPVAPGGPSERRRIAITYSDRSAGDAALALPCMSSGGRRRVSIPLVPARGGRAELARCGADARRPYAHISVEGAKFGGAERQIDLPEGCFEARLSAPGHSPGPWVRVEAIAAEPRDKVLPKAGRIRFRATEAGKPVPVRLLVRGAGGTPDPDWGDDSDGGAALNVDYAERGEGERPLPPGKYHVALGRGFEYTAHEQDIEITAGGVVEVRADLARVVDTTGWIASDLHLHADPSPDAPVRLEDRVRSLVSVGVEAAVATDHNAVTDYAPTIRAMGLSGAIASIVGDEVTTRDYNWGHFNVFPMASGAPPFPWVGVLPAEVFAAARAASPRTLVQVNHPRWGGIGYFDILRMDRANVKGWLDRSPLADMGFDLLEVFNGDHYRRVDLVEDVMRDWYALLDAGFRTVATGNSDSHKLTYHEAGMPRNLVFVGKDAPGEFDEAAFTEALKGGKVVVSSGPFVRLEVAGKGVGETVAAGEAEIVVRVDAPPWVDVDRIELWRRGKNLRAWPVANRKGAVEQRTRETLAKGDWIIAIARGTKTMDAYAPGARPFGFTNPVFVK